jgi:hypothetical protein
LETYVKSLGEYIKFAHSFALFNSFFSLYKVIFRNRKARLCACCFGSPAIRFTSLCSVLAPIGFSWLVLCTGLSVINPIGMEILFDAGENLIGLGRGQQKDCNVKRGQRL